MLRVISQAPTRSTPPHLKSLSSVGFEEGFYAEEQDDFGSFRWMTQRGSLNVEPQSKPAFLEFWAASEFHDLSQSLSVQVGETTTCLELLHGRARNSVPVPAHIGRVNLEASCLFPSEYYPEDSRRLALRIAQPLLHCDSERHAHVTRQYDNALRNTKELLGGKTVLNSTPTSLGIDLHGVCNVKPPCVYCEWDSSKEFEGDNVDVPFTRETLEEYAEFFDNTTQLVNCSIGEPFMMKNLDELLDIFRNRGKILEVTTNGQILTDRNIERLLGHDIDLYISLDAGTPETYAKLRNDRLQTILVNLNRLITAKGGRQGLPRVHLVFMPMRVNVHELPAFVKLCAELDVDRMVLRPLNHADSIDLKWEREGYEFDYQKELLPFPELVRVSGQAAELCRRHEVPLADQMDFGGALQESFQDEFAAGQDEIATISGPASPPESGSEESDLEQSGAPAPDEMNAESGSLSPESPLPLLGGEHLPPCLEPWKSLYILRRGVLPCCYGGQAIAPMGGYRDAWNSPIMQGIREELAAGRFHQYCLDSPSCPIVRKSEHAQTLPWHQRSFLGVRRVWHRFDRRLAGVPRKVLFPLKWVGVRLWVTATNPSYLAAHLKRTLSSR